MIVIQRLFIYFFCLFGFPLWISHCLWAWYLLKSYDFVWCIGWIWWLKRKNRREKIFKRTPICWNSLENMVRILNRSWSSARVFVSIFITPLFLAEPLNILQFNLVFFFLSIIIYFKSFIVKCNICSGIIISTGCVGGVFNKLQVFGNNISLWILANAAQPPPYFLAQRLLLEDKP